MWQQANMTNNTIKNIEVLFEDDNYLIVNKAAGMLSIPDRYNHSLVNLKHSLESKHPSIFVVHRLDRDTSGIIMFAKNAEAHKYANDLFENHQIERIYHVFVKGAFPTNFLEIDIPLLANEAEKGIIIPSARGKHSLTIVKLLEKYRFISLLECNLITGRQHQIRVHLAAIGHPLLVDPLYADNSEFKLSTIKKNFNSREEQEERPLIKRLSMHAYSLKFYDKIANKEIYVNCPYPKDFEILQKKLKKFSPSIMY